MTGLQVKKSNMSGTKILNEMRPPSNKGAAVKERGTKKADQKSSRGISCVPLLLSSLLWAAHTS